VITLAWLKASPLILAPPLSGPGLRVCAVAPPTEAQLRAVLARERCEIAVLVVDASVRGAAYATVALLDSQGLPRPVNAQPLGQCLAQQGVRLAVLCSGGAPEALHAVATAWVDKGVRAVATLGGASTAAVERLLDALAQGADLTAAVERSASAMSTRSSVGLVGDGTMRWGAAPPAAAPSAAAVDPTPVPAPSIDPLVAKRASNRYDVFLCHNSADKPSVKRIGGLLKSRGILPWLDEWELPPGQPWQSLLEQQIGRIRSAAVFIGGSGISPWHQQEMRGFISEFVDRQVPVIPVLLPEAPARPELPLFLRQMTWVDFRVNDPDPLDRLVWGITGQRPEQARSL
jgi:TIR domain